jgi:glucose-6-phosphate 1-dehydrogenase
VQVWESTPGPLPQYEAGSQGPAEAEQLLINGNHWRAI